MAYCPAPDIAALAREAGIPTDDPGVLAFARLIAFECASICRKATPDGDADHVTEQHARDIGRELANQIEAIFEVC